MRRVERFRPHATTRPAAARRRRRVVPLIVVALMTLGLTGGRGGTADAAPVAVFTYSVRGWDNGSDLEAFAARAGATLADGRGWSLGGSVAFQRVASGGDFTLWLSAAVHLPSFSSVCSVEWSCSVGRNVIINETRWLNASPAWVNGGGGLDGYRDMVVNHEVGHWLGFGHAWCGGAGQPAPVMQQQSISLQGCRFNAWPSPAERQSFANARGYPIYAGSPTGSVDEVAEIFGGYRVRGWALDPDTAAPIAVHIYIDGTPVAIVANAYRPDVGAAFPGFGPNHGFDVAVPATPGVHQVCVYGIEATGSGENRTLGCRSVETSVSPIGSLDAAQRRPGGVRVAGWALDPDTSASIPVHVYVDGVGYALNAAGLRPDVAAVYGRGAAHGFEAVVPATSGLHTVCAYGIQVAGAGTNRAIGCSVVAVGGAPGGSFDELRPVPGGLRVRGWALDPDTAGPIVVHVYVGGRGYIVSADQPRPDVEAALPGFGLYHGFDSVLNLAAGTYSVCVYAIESAGLGSNRSLGCRSASVG